MKLVTLTKKELLFTQAKRSTSVKLKRKKDGCHLRQQTFSCVNKLTRKSANQRPSSPWAYLTKQIYK
jgi:hypothetical protein